MITTNYKDIENEIAEVVYLFTDAKVFNLTHKLIVSDDTIINNIEIDDDSQIYTSKFNKNCDNLEYKRILKRTIKLDIYKILEKKFKRELPWGALTGIRPVKLAYSATSEGKDYNDFLRNEMLVSQKKADIIDKIIKTQVGIYERNDENADLFVGIPFCPSKCLYCSFVSAIISKNQNLIEPYVIALCKEIEASKPLIKKSRSVYIGGGTPVSLDYKHLEKILNAIGEVNVEFTVEAGRPDCITTEILQLLKDYNVTRICLNPQTFNDKTLEIIGRKHTAKDIYDKYELAKKFNFDINMDLIAGLPNENYDDFLGNVQKAIDLKPANITIHTLSLKRGSILIEKIDRLDDGDAPKMIEDSHILLQDNNYNPYYLYRQKYMAGNLENTGYSLENKECVYNIDIMEEISQNIACGANSVSKRVFNLENRIERYGSPKDILTYINKIDKIIDEKNKLFD